MDERTGTVNDSSSDRMNRIPLPYRIDIIRALGRQAAALWGLVDRVNDDGARISAAIHDLDDIIGELNVHQGLMRNPSHLGIRSCWQDEFLEALTEYVIEHGEPDRNHLPPNWTRDQAAENLLVIEHIRDGCGPLLSECSYGDWHERYQNSYDFADCDSGVEVMVTCECRLISYVPWRVMTGFGELIRALTRESP